MNKIIFVLMCAGAISASASMNFSIDHDSSEAHFLAIGKPSAIKIKGEHAKPDGNINITDDGTAKGEIKINLDEFSTGMQTRDEHMKEKYLETNKPENKFAVLSLKHVDLPKGFWKSPHPIEVPFTGQLHLHGRQKDVNGNIKFDQVSNDLARGDAKFSINLPDYGISTPSFSGITVAEKVDIDVNFKGTTKKL
jgi:polyisoprenoid-binding protein YceI